jgi:N6-adenosine-specific RNA methylase IME4
MKNTKFNIIYLDPPWKFANFDYATATRGAAKEYKTMSFEDLLKLPIGDIADEDCSMFMWCPDTHIPEMLKLFESYGFKFKTKAFTWIKTTKAVKSFYKMLDMPISHLITAKNFTKMILLAKTMFLPRMGMGKWTRKETESCYLAVKGKPRRVNFGVRECIFAETGQHSAKPLEARHRIVKLLGDIPRIEIFARNNTALDSEGWLNVGDGIDDNDITSTINLILKSNQ